MFKIIIVPHVPPAVPYVQVLLFVRLVSIQLSQSAIKCALHALSSFKIVNNAAVPQLAPYALTIL